MTLILSDRLAAAFAARSAEPPITFAASQMQADIMELQDGLARAADLAAQLAATELDQQQRQTAAQISAQLSLSMAELIETARRARRFVNYIGKPRTLLQILQET